MDHYGAKKNRHYNVVNIGDLNPDSILSDAVLSDRFWYILDHDGTLVGCIGSRSILEFARQERLPSKRFSVYSSRRRRETDGD